MGRLIKTGVAAKPMDQSSRLVPLSNPQLKAARLNPKMGILSTFVQTGALERGSRQICQISSNGLYHQLKMVT